MIQCDATWSTEVYDNFKEYKDGKTKSISTGYGIEFGPSINADIGLSGNFKNKWFFYFIKNVLCVINAQYIK